MSLRKYLFNIPANLKEFLDIVGERKEPTIDIGISEMYSSDIPPNKGYNVIVKSGDTKLRIYKKWGGSGLADLLHSSLMAEPTPYQDALREALLAVKYLARLGVPIMIDGKCPDELKPRLKQIKLSTEKEALIANHLGSI